MVRRWNFVFFVLLVVLSNVVDSYFNIAYNRGLIVHHYLDEAQRLQGLTRTLGGPILLNAPTPQARRLEQLSGHVSSRWVSRSFHFHSLCFARGFGPKRLVPGFIFGP